jgi:hypothetical protein
VSTVQALPSERLLIGMTDIALLAGVRRPVVSMWRSRSAGGHDPFPTPVGSARGRDSFDAVEVASWLARTRRGNNPTPVEDAAAFAAVAGASPREDRAVFDAVSALLCLKAAAATPLAAHGRAGLLDLADEVDPKDEFLYAELVSARDLPRLARYADLLADAAVSPRDAFERLMADRWRSDLADHASTMIAPSALCLAARVAVELADRDGGPATYVDPTPGSSDLLLTVLAEHGDRGPVDVVTVGGDDPAVRLVRRRLWVHDVHRAGLRVESDGTFTVDRPVVQVAQFPTPARPVMGAEQILAAVENIAMQMDGNQRGVVLAPVSALCDRIVDRKTAGIRAGLLRAGHVHAIVRLPKGLVPSKSRQALAMWVLGAADRSIRTEDRFSAVADLANETLGADVVDDLVTDLAVAAAGLGLARARAFRFVRPVNVRLLLTARSSLVEAGTVDRGTGPFDPAQVMVDLEQALAALEPSVPVVPRLPAARLAGGAALSPRTVGELVGSTTLRALSGTRLDDADLGTGVGLRVLGVAEVTGDAPVGRRVIDPLRLAAYPTVRVTEPGDVVFCTNPRPAAMVDREGSSVVRYPARVLRIDPADPGGLVADLIAADVNAVPAHAREWRLWTVRRVSDAQRSTLAGALAEIDRARSAVRDRLSQLDRLADLIARGVASGALALDDADSSATEGS